MVVRLGVNFVNGIVMHPGKIGKIPEFPNLANPVDLGGRCSAIRKVARCFESSVELAIGALSRVHPREF